MAWIVEVPPSPIAFADLDADQIARWKASMIAHKLAPQTVNTYLTPLGTILNAAIDSDYLPRSPLTRKSGAGRVTAVKNQKVPRREVWLDRQQLDRLATAIAPRYRVLVVMAALTGMRWGELSALRWDDLRLDQALNDGAVDGPGRLRDARAVSDPRRSPRPATHPRDLAYRPARPDDRGRQSARPRQPGGHHDGLRPCRQAGRAGRAHHRRPRPHEELRCHSRGARAAAGAGGGVWPVGFDVVGAGGRRAWAVR